MNEIDIIMFEKLLEEAVRNEKELVQHVEDYMAT